MSQITRGHGQDNNYNVAYHFSIQRMDYFHSLSMASNHKIGTLSLQLALGHRSLQARTATAYQFGESPFSMQFNAGASLNAEKQKASTHSFPDYNLAIGLAYAIH